MGLAIKAGLAYFAIVFFVGFILGAVRVLLIVPVFGALVATLLEVPFMLLVSWISCRMLVKRLHVTRDASLSMGLIAFSCLMLAEISISPSAAAFAEALVTPAGLVGFSAQLVFALMPLWRVDV